MTDVRATVLLSPERWALLPPLFAEPPCIYFGCPWCRAAMRYAGLLTGDGYAVEPAQCESCGRAFELFLHGWRGRPAAWSAVIPQEPVAQADGAGS